MLFPIQHQQFKAISNSIQQQQHRTATEQQTKNQKTKKKTKPKKSRDKVNCSVELSDWIILIFF